MCEPAHSITQFPPDNLGGPTFGDRVGNMIDRALDFGCSILGWRNYSKMGKGHTESIECGRLPTVLPPHVLYEAKWWERTVALDGPFPAEIYMMFRGREWVVDKLKEESFASAKEYANQLSIGSLSALRRFLELSMQGTDRHYQYISRFADYMLNAKGKVRFSRNLPQLTYCGRRMTCKGVENLSSCYDTQVLKSLTKAMVGMTRKRELLASVWADDDSLWNRGNQKNPRNL